MASCVNISSSEFKDLFKNMYPYDFETSKSLQQILAAQVKNWQEANSTDRFPKSTELQLHQEAINNASVATLEGAAPVQPISLPRSIITNVPPEFINNKMGFTQEAVKTYSQLYFKALFKDPSRVLSIFSDTGTNNLHADIQNEVRQDIENVLQNPKFASLHENWIKLYENLELIKSIHIKELVKYNIEVISEENIKNEEEGSTTDLWVTESLKYSSKQKASSNIRLIVGSSIRPIKNKVFGGFELVDFGKTFNILANKLSNKTSLKEILETMTKYQTIEPGLKTIKERVFKDSSSLGKADIITILQFAQTFGKHYNDYLFSFVGNEGIFNTENAVINTFNKRMLDNWNTLSIGLAVEGHPAYKLTDGAITYNTKYFQDIFKSGDTVKTLDTLIKENHELVTINEAEAEALGYPKNQLGNYEIPAIERQYLGALKILSVLGADIPAVKNTVPSEGLGDFIKSLNTVINEILKGTGLVFSKNSNVKGFLQPIIDHAINMTPDFVENQYLNFNNETQYNVQLNSFLTLVEDVLANQSTLEQVKESLPFYNNPFTEQSVVLKKMFPEGDKIPTKLKMSFVEGLKNDVTNDAKQYANLSHADKLISSLNMAIEGYHPVFRPGDNSLERVYNMSFYSKNMNTAATIKALSADMVNALISEIEYFKSLNNTDTQYLLGDIRNQETPHKSSIFIDIIEKAKLTKAFNDAVKQDISLSPDNINRFESAFDSYFKDMVQNTISYLESFNVIEKKGDVYKNNFLKGLNGEVSEYSLPVLTRNITHILANRAMWGVEQFRLFSGHPMFYKDADNFFKRMSAMVGTKKRTFADPYILPALEKEFKRLNSTRLYKTDNNISTNHTEGTMVVRTSVFNDFNVKSSLIGELSKTKEFKDFNFADYNNMNEADAIAYLSLDFYRDLRLLSGDWSNADERLYQWVNRGNRKEIIYTNFDGTKEPINSEQQLVNLDGKRTTFNMLKPQYFGPLAEAGFIPSMYKLGAVPLLPNTDIRQFPNVGKMLNQMKKQNIDMITFNSANKVGTKLNQDGKIQSLFNRIETTDGRKVGELNIDGYVTQDTYMDYWGIQLDTGNTFKSEAPSGSQFSKLITSNIFGVDSTNNKELIQLAKDFNKINSELIELGVKELKEEIQLETVTNNENITVYSEDSVKKLIKLFYDETAKRSGTAATLESIQLLEYYIDRGLGLDILSNRDKIENILAAIADSRVISQKRNGSGFIQMPSTLFELGDNGYRYLDENLQYMSNHTVRLRPNGVMEVLLPNRFKKMMGNVDVTIEIVNGKPVTIYKNITAEALQMIGFRIPTSGLNSIERIEVIGFLPAEYGDTVLLPSDIVAKAGSDFDIDKLNIFIKNLIRDENNQLVPEQYINGKENTRGALENQLIDISWKILRHPENRAQHLESIGTDRIKKERDRIVKERKAETKKPTFTDIVFNIPFVSDVVQRNITSKQLTGIAALHTTDHQLTTQNGVFLGTYQGNELKAWDFEDKSYHKLNDGISLAHTKTVDGFYISSNLNQGLNASVDGAKDPLFFDLNISLENSNIIFTLMRSGMSLRNIMTFMNQPIIRDYSKLEEMRKSVTNDLLDAPLTPKSVIDKLIKKYGDKLAENTVTFSDMEKMLDAEVAMTFDNKRKQARLLYAYLDVKKSAEVLNEYMQATRLDTQGPGKSTSDLDLKLTKAKIIADDKLIGIFNAYKVLKEDGFLYPHYQALQTIQELFKPLFIVSKSDTEIGLSAFQDNYKRLLNKLSKSIYLNNEEKVKILDLYKIDYIGAQVVNSEINIYGQSYGVPITKLNSLISGKNSVAKRLKNLKKTHKHIPLIDALQPILGSESINLGHTNKDQIVDHVKLYDQRLDPAESNTYMESFRELLSNPETHEFAKDLAVLTFLQSGLANSPLTYTKLIPPEVYMEIVDSAFNSNTIFNADKFDALFLLNNYHLESLIPTVYSEKRQKNRFIYKYFSDLPNVMGKSKEEKENMRRRGEPIRNTIPVIEININSQIRENNLLNENLLTVLNIDSNQNGKYRITPLGYRDLTRNRMLIGYNESIPLKATKKEINKKESSKELLTVLRKSNQSKNDKNVRNNKICES
jgi:hypothetical protein